MVNMVPHFYLFVALCELFDKADTGGDGTISIPEYIAMCEEYGVALTEEHINTVKAIANENGEVYCFIVKKYPTSNLTWPADNGPLMIRGRGEPSFTSTVLKGLIIVRKKYASWVPP